MAAGAGRDRDQAVGALLDRLVSEAVVDDVVERDAALAMHRLVHLDARAQRGDDDRHACISPQVAMSSCSRVFERWTIWLTA